MNLSQQTQENLLQHGQQAETFVWKSYRLVTLSLVQRYSTTFLSTSNLESALVLVSNTSLFSNNR